MQGPRFFAADRFSWIDWRWLWTLDKFERGIWFKYKACSLISSGSVLLYIEHWAGMCNAVIKLKNRSKTKALHLFFAACLCLVAEEFDAAGYREDFRELLSQGCNPTERERIMAIIESGPPNRDLPEICGRTLRRISDEIRRSLR